MIEKMRKVTFFFEADKANQVFLELQRAGLVHFGDAKNKSQGQEGLEEMLKKVRFLLGSYSETNFHFNGAIQNLERDLNLMNQLSSIKEELNQTQKEIESLADEFERAKDYSDFDPSLISKIEKQGLYLQHFRVREADIRMLDGLDWFLLFAGKQYKYILVVTKEKSLGLELKELTLPSRSYKELESIIAHRKLDLHDLRCREQILLRDPSPLIHLESELINLLAFEQAKSNTQIQGQMAWATGFCLERKIPILKEVTGALPTAIFNEETKLDENVPVKLVHSPISKLFEPVLDFIGVLPGYEEKDASGLFLVFFTIFFALLVGDAGYGVVMLGLALAFKIKGLSSQPQVFSLFFLLSGATIFWGAITGQWFGYEPILNGPLGALVVPQLNVFAKESEPLIIRLVFIIGLLQLQLAHFWQLLVGRGLAKKLTQVGWMFFLWGCYHLAEYFLLKISMPFFLLWLFVLGLGLVVFFGEQGQGRSFIKGVAFGLANFPMNLLGAVGFFSDLVSYIRLFALGLATKEMALAANGLALGMGFDTVTGAVSAILILILGHTVNITLAALAVMVHGVRLNFLEFAKHLDLQWTGEPFAPLRRKTEEL
ncbi:MAG: hypothetical protein QNL04_02060 [SAR324 cluster bacterium]|nr:hypothetical protein [SAR324 cluster bacterium]